VEVCAVERQSKSMGKNPYQNLSLDLNSGKNIYPKKKFINLILETPHTPSRFFLKKDKTC
jgi:hypothetical protein